jgi:transcription elongation factor Elf1
MWLESKYIGLLSTRLDRFKRRNNSYNFRCPICGDSQTSKTKARGWIYSGDKGSFRYHCFNCETHHSFPNFLKNVDQTLYNQYRLEKLQESKTPDQIEYEQFVEKLKPKAFISSSPLKNLKKVSQLSLDNKIKQYVDGRKLPTPYHAKLFSCPNFMTWTNELIPDKFDTDGLKFDETRLLIPFIDKNQKLHAYQGRSLNPKSKSKYITIVLDDSTPVVYGIDTCNFDKKYYVFEGPFDSMFVKNSVASAGGDIVASLGSFNKENAVIIYDNEPRSKETKQKLDKAIMNGYNVCIWPENMNHKDINDMILAGLSSEFIKHIIDSNTYRDLAAKLALTKWSKV